MNFESKIVTSLTLLLAVYESPWTLPVRLAVSAVAFVTVFRHDLSGRWGTRGRNDIEKRLNELDTRDFIRKHQRLCWQRVLGGCITLAVGLYLWDLKMSTSVVRLLPPLDQAMFLVSILAFNSAVQSFWQTDRNWLKKERDRFEASLPPIRLRRPQREARIGQKVRDICESPNGRRQALGTETLVSRRPFPFAMEKA